jgi:hypothetical protein
MLPSFKHSWPVVLLVRLVDRAVGTEPPGGAVLRAWVGECPGWLCAENRLFGVGKSVEGNLFRYK